MFLQHPMQLFLFPLLCTYIVVKYKISHSVIQKFCVTQKSRLIFNLDEEYMATMTKKLSVRAIRLFYITLLLYVILFILPYNIILISYILKSQFEDFILTFVFLSPHLLGLYLTLYHSQRLLKIHGSHPKFRDSEK